MAGDPEKQLGKAAAHPPAGGIAGGGILGLFRVHPGMGRPAGSRLHRRELLLRPGATRSAHGG